MGWGVGDFNLDGALDLLNTDLGPTHLYLRNPLPPGAPAGALPTFTDATLAWGLTALTWRTSSWNPLVHDFDRDGAEDVYLGLSLQSPSDSDFVDTQTVCSTFQPPASSTDVLLRNEGGQGFTASKLPADGSPDILNIAQGLLDLDGDGDLDIVQVRPDSKPPLSKLRVLRNDVVKLGGAVRLVLVGTTSNRHAIGARVDAKLAGQPRQRRVAGNHGTGSTSTRHVHFGLGAAPALDEVVVTWPDGKTTALGSLAAGTAWQVDEATGVKTAL
jgi:hypothetical protein